MAYMPDQMSPAQMEMRRRMMQYSQGAGSPQPQSQAIQGGPIDDTQNSIPQTQYADAQSPSQSQPNGPFFTGPQGPGPGSTAYQTPTSVGNPYNNRDVFDQAQQFGQNNYNTGRGWDEQFGNMAQDFHNKGAGYTDLTNSLYNPIWQGGGGYTQDQMDQVKNGKGLQDIQNDLPNNFLTPTEQQQIQGDPYAASHAWSQQAPALSQIASDSGKGLYDQVNAGRDINNGIYSNWQGQNNDALNGGQQNSNFYLGNLRSDYDSAIDPNALSVSSGYQSGIDSDFATGRSRIDQAIGNPDLNVTDEYKRQAGMTDQEVENRAAEASRDVGAGYNRVKDAATRSAMASGSVSPLALAATQAGLERNSSLDKADALQRARSDARAEQRNAAQGVQDTTLRAGQYKSGLTADQAAAERNARVASDTSGEQLRLGANQNIASDRMRAADAYGQAGLNASQFDTNARLNSNNALGSSQSAANQNFTGMGMNAAQQAGNWNLGQANTNATNFANYEGAGEAQSSQRAGALASNRQGINQNNQNTSMAINNAQSNRAVTAYNPWLSAQAEGRQAAQNQQNSMNGQADTNTQFRLGGWQTANQGQAAAGGQYAGWGAGGGQGFGDVLSNSFGNALGKTLGTFGANNQGSGGFGGYQHGGMIDRHRMIEVGEHDRPELILPLDPATPPEQWNQFERMGHQLGKHMGFKQSGPANFPRPHAHAYAEGGVVGGARQKYDQEVDKARQKAVDARGYYTPADQHYIYSMASPEERQALRRDPKALDMEQRYQREHWQGPIQQKTSYADGGIVGGGMSDPNTFATNLREIEGAANHMDNDDPRYADERYTDRYRYARGGVVSGCSYQSNMGREAHRPSGRTEMGTLAYA